MDDQRTDRTSGSMSNITEGKRFRFGLRGLLLVMTMLAFSIVAYREGYRNGYKAAKDESQADYVIWKSPQEIEPIERAAE